MIARTWREHSHSQVRKPFPPTPYSNVTLCVAGLCVAGLGVAGLGVAWSRLCCHSSRAGRRPPASRDLTVGRHTVSRRRAASWRVHVYKYASSSEQPIARVLQRIACFAADCSKQDQAEYVGGHYIGEKMRFLGLHFSALIGAVASARSMTPMASIAAPGLPHAGATRTAGSATVSVWCVGDGGG